MTGKRGRARVMAQSHVRPNQQASTAPSADHSPMRLASLGAEPLGSIEAPWSY